MFRLFLPGIAGFVLFALWLFCIFDVIATDESLARNLPKMVWLLLVILVPTIGSIAWLALGRPRYAGLRPGRTDVRPPPPRTVRGLEDSEEWERRRRRPDEPDAGGD
jgi:hypothetical protein